MKKIYKYLLGTGLRPQIPMPKGSIVLSVGHDPGGELCIWAEVDPDAEVEQSHFAIRMTGEETGQGEDFIGTVKSGAFMLHVYESEEM